VLAFGGRGIIKSLDVCITRLRVELESTGALNEEALEAAGVQGVMRPDDGIIHLLVWLNADEYAAEMQGQLAGSR